MRTHDVIKAGPELDDRAVFHVLTSLALRIVSLVLRIVVVVLGRLGGRRRR